jgi:transglutaminase-like putative cysteine protease
MRPVGATEFLDHHTPAVREFAARAAGDTPRERAVDLYYLIRDGLEYEIYGADFSREALRASTIAQSTRGLCIHKSTLYAACARALDIPSRLVFGDVRNHVASPRLKRYLGGDVVHYHCYARLELDGHWVSATPVFSKRLCQLYRMTPLEFDGVHDSTLQENDGSHMEVVRTHGVFDDLPYERVVAGLRAAHPNLFAGSRVRAGSLVAEAA